MGRDLKNSPKDSMPPKIMYGPIVQGSKKSVTNIPNPNAPSGEVIFAIIFCTFGLKKRGISVPIPPGL